MSIWTDLLFVGGHIATPEGLAAVTEGDKDDADDVSHEPTSGVARTAAPPRPTPIPLPAPQPRELERALPRANKISPNDLW